MGRLIAGVVALAIGVLGAMYWGQAQQADASQREPLVPSIGAQADLTDSSNSECPYLREHPDSAGNCEGQGCEGGGCSHCPNHKDGETSQTSI